MNGHREIINLLNLEFGRVQSRNPQYSFRAFAKKLDIYPSALSELINGKRRFTHKMAKKVLLRLGVDPKQSQNILSGLTPPSRRKSNAREFSSGIIKFEQMDMDHFHVLSDWFYFAVYTLADTEDFVEDPKWIGKRLGIPIRNSKQALERLERVGLFIREDGKLKSKSIPLATTSDIANSSIRKNHFQNLELARKSLETDDVAEREFSTMMMATTPKKLLEAKNKIKKFRRELCAFLEADDEGPREEVFQFNVQLFPLTKRKKRER